MATPYRLILASGSLGRRELLKQAGYQFEVMPSNIEEHDGTGVTDPRRYVAELAWQKAAAVYSQLTADSSQPTPHGLLRTQHSGLRTLILAADSTVWHEGQIIGKPLDEADARRILGLLAGTTHELWTGVCLWRLDDGVQLCWQEKSDVAFRALSREELEHLINSKVWEGKAGGYGIESFGDPYLTVKTGTVSNVIGLPVETLQQILEWWAITPHWPEAKANIRIFAEVTWRFTAKVDSVGALDSTLDSIAKEVSPELPQAVNITRANGDCLTLVLGATNGSFLSFIAQSGNPPYFVSLGDPAANGIYTYFVDLDHHSEADARNVISEIEARQAVREFVSQATGLPKSITWTEV